MTPRLRRMYWVSDPLQERHRVVAGQPHAQHAGQRAAAQERRRLVVEPQDVAGVAQQELPVLRQLDVAALRDEERRPDELLETAHLQ
ncbi:hypothetical protein [Rubellimicrobium mesophilum]|uniref:hypothetical protein n=1 Tax=Rubellimicrobium mesophilum TaxID=1123067 RepID=UPI001FE03151|nr:hypothetical protein [Rubellimicrobium mesophilum]